jgi:excisionase family DNA binding protein
MAGSPLEIQPNAVYTLRDACQILQVSSATMMRWLKEGKIPSARIGRGYRFLGSQLLEALALPEPIDEAPATEANPPGRRGRPRS